MGDSLRTQVSMVRCSSRPSVRMADVRDRECLCDLIQAPGHLPWPRHRTNPSRSTQSPRESLLRASSKASRAPLARRRRGCTAPHTSTGSAG
eukprot:229573-Chlamydomonas_euryale.AAC.4